jgi:WD40 repeat protein
LGIIHKDDENPIDESSKEKSDAVSIADNIEAEIDTSTRLPIIAENLEKLDYSGLGLEVPSVIEAVAISPNTNYVAVASDEGVNIYDLKDAGNKNPVFTESFISELVFSDDENWLAGITNDGNVIVWSVWDGMPAANFIPENMRAVAIDFSADSKVLHILDLFGSFSALELQSDSIIRSYELTGEITTEAVFSSDHQLIAIGSLGAHLSIWRVSDGSLVSYIDPYDQPPMPLPWIWHILFLPDGDSIITFEDYHPAPRIWDINSGALLFDMAEEKGLEYLCYDISPDGSLLAAGTQHGRLLFIDMDSGDILDSYKAHSDTIDNIIFSLNGEQLISTSSNGEILIWEIN